MCYIWKLVTMRTMPLPPHDAREISSRPHCILWSQLVLNATGPQRMLGSGRLSSFLLRGSLPSRRCWRAQALISSESSSLWHSTCLVHAGATPPSCISGLPPNLPTFWGCICPLNRNTLSHQPEMQGKCQENVTVSKNSVMSDPKAQTSSGQKHTRVRRGV